MEPLASLSPTTASENDASPGAGKAVGGGAEEGGGGGGGGTIVHWQERMTLHYRLYPATKEEGTAGDQDDDDRGGECIDKFCGGVVCVFVGLFCCYLPRLVL